MIFKIASRNIFRHKVRSLITLSAIIFGCVALIFVGGFFEDLYSQMRDTFIYGNTGHLQVYKRGYSEHGRIEPYKYFLSNYQEISEEIMKIPEVDFVTSRIQFFGLMSTGQAETSFWGQGVDPQFERTLVLDDVKDFRKLYSKNRFNALPVIEAGVGLMSTDEYSLLMGHGLAEGINAQVGTQVTLLTNTIAGSTNALDLEIKGIAQVPVKSVDDVFLRIPLKTAQKLLNTNSVQTVVIQLHQTKDTPKVKQALMELFKAKKYDLELKDWEQLSDFYSKTVEMFNIFHLILRTVVSIVVALGIFNTLNMSVMERTSEIGTMMAMGNRKKDIWTLFLAEGLIVGLVGGLLGVLLGSLVVSFVSHIGIPMPPGPGSTVYWLSHPGVVPKVLLVTFLLAIVTAVASAFYPAYRASQMVVVEALRKR